MSERTERCFAHRADGECAAVSTGYCPGYTRCSLYKSLTGQINSDIASEKRLNSLPDGQQHFIADKYYAGMMPWRG